MNHADQASKMVKDFHVGIQDWFRGNNNVSAAQLLHAFSAQFQMTGANGQEMDFPALAAWLLSVKGSRPGIIVSFDNLWTASTFHHTLVYYEETQSMGDITTKRRSSAIFRLEGDDLKWWRLQEEWM
ncbi:hypothetical protein [Chitinophaga vietnamensis]|uniref:hypothetical protein n=1 Tax=Chitinophaga vietnamensis TaxID=2593957 RepID=UPI001178C3D6|nr:hypothetical protein [Chitinophaga vietnamensis]